ncbi:MAG: hypothetical protein WCO07_01460 [bacterium]
MGSYISKGANGVAVPYIQITTKQKEEAIKASYSAIETAKMTRWNSMLLRRYAGSIDYHN